MRRIFIATGVICFFLISVIIQTSAAQDVISGCYSQRNGELRIVSDSSNCKKREDFIQWNVQGPQGEQGVPGECDCPITQEQLDEIYERLERLESRFKDMDDGTIRDNKTGLLWLKNANCFDRITWSEAMNEASLLENGLCGLTDGSAPGNWRLPTKGEWEGFISLYYTYPALVNTKGNHQWSEGDAFTGVQSRSYWSSTESISNDVYILNMDRGQIAYGPGTNDYYVWPVRDGN